MSSRAVRRYNSAGASMMSPLGGGLGGAFLLINALSQKIYELLQDTSDTIIRGYEAGGLVGLLRSRQIRKLAKRYLWLVAVAFAFERLRTMWAYLNVFGSLTQYLHIDATLKPGDQAYEWMLAFWEHHHSFKTNSRDFVVETGPVTKSKRGQRAMMQYGANIWDDMGTSNGDGEQEMHTRVSPKENSDQWIWHAGTLFYLRRWTHMSGGARYDMYSGPGVIETSMISVRSYSFTRKPLFKLLEEAKRVYEKTKPDMVTVRVLDQRGTWRKVAYRHKRPLNSIIMDDKKREELLRDAREFLSAESWYTKRGIPWKRGYLLWGSPGTGKSSTIQALASEIKLDVYVISINSQGMNDSMLSAALRSIPPRSLVCMEDVDVSFSTQKRDLDGAKARPTRMMNPYEGMGLAMTYPGGASRGSTITLSAMLNAIDGMESNEGRLLFLTTNALQDLDAALIRPGRVDLFIEYKKARPSHAEELFNIFYSPSTRMYTEAGSTSTKTPEDPDTINVLPEKTPQPFELPAHISQLDIVAWAKEWSAQVPDEVFTIAELQGMLLAYKREPEAAVAAMSAWVKKEVLAKEQAAKEKEEKEKEEKANKAQEKEDEESKADERSVRKGKKAELQAQGISLLAGGAGLSSTINGLAKPDQIDKGVGTETISQKDQIVQASSATPAVSSSTYEAANGQSESNGSV